MHHYKVDKLEIEAMVKKLFQNMEKQEEKIIEIKLYPHNYKPMRYPSILEEREKYEKNQSIHSSAVCWNDNGSLQKSRKQTKCSHKYHR